jgi:hypothetical protein
MDNKFNPSAGSFFQKFLGQGPLSPKQGSTVSQDAAGPVYLYGSLKTYEHPITEFPGDILIPTNAAGSVTTLSSGLQLPNNCVGLRFINLVGNVLVSVNGGGQRIVQNNDSFSGVRINSLIIFTDATGTCVLQSVGTGD